MDNPKKIAVVLLQFGGLSHSMLSSRFSHLFSDPDIFELPFGPRFQRFVAKQISSASPAHHLWQKSMLR